MGRSTKLNAERQARLCEALRAGNTRSAAADYAGIGVSTFYKWLDRGEKEEEGIYVDFREAVKKAEADAEVRNVALIQRAATGGTWQAAAWWLERRRPARWAQGRNRTDGLAEVELPHRSRSEKETEGADDKSGDQILEINRLYRLQLDRIEMLTRAGGISSQRLSAEIALALNLLKRSHEMKMDLGIGGGKNLGTMTFRPEMMVEISERYGEDITGAIEDSEARNKVLSIARSLSEFKQLPSAEDLFGEADDQDKEGTA